MKQINPEKKNMVSEVYLLTPGNSVLKQYITNPKLRNQTQNRAHWKKEVVALTRLKGLPHFPQLISYDQKTMRIVMSYCGPNVTKEALPKNWIKQCDQIGRKITSMHMYHNDVYVKNICVKDGVLYLIDWGMWDTRMHRNNSMIEAIRRELGL